MKNRLRAWLSVALILGSGYFVGQYGLRAYAERARAGDAAGVNAAPAPPAGGIAQEDEKDGGPQAVAEVVGRVKLDGAKESGGVTVTVFNGFEKAEGLTAADGTYRIPLTRSDEQTAVTVFAGSEGYAPQVKHTLVSFKQVEGGQTPEVAVAEMVLKPSDQKGLGVLVGVGFIRSVSGRPRKHEGIIAYDAGATVKIEGASAQTTVTADASGVFNVALPPGTYRLTTDRNIVIEQVELAAGRATFQPIFAGEQINF